MSYKCRIVAIGTGLRQQLEAVRKSNGRLGQIFRIRSDLAGQPAPRLRRRPRA